MLTEYDVELIKVKAYGCRACRASDMVPTEDGLVDIYCELLNKPGASIKPVVTGVDPHVGAPLPLRCPYYFRDKERKING